MNEGCQTLGIIPCAHKILSRRPDTVYPLPSLGPTRSLRGVTPLGCISSVPQAMADLTSLLCYSKPGPHLFSQTSVFESCFSSPCPGIVPNLPITVVPESGAIRPLWAFLPPR